MKTMKIFFAALALLAMASCVKEEPVAPETVDGLSFTASRSLFAKTQLVDGYKVEWKAGDQIALFNTNGTAFTETNLPTTEKWRRCFPFNTQVSGAEARFVINSTDNSAKAEGAQPYLFLYPYDWTYVSLIDADQMMCRFWLTDQVATLGSFDPKYSPAAAKSETLDEKIVFKNLLPLLKFTVPASLNGRITKITVTGNNSENVAGNMLCDYSGDKPKVYVFSEFKEEYKYKGGKTSVALTSTSGMAAGDYYLAIAPKTYSKGLKITVTYSDTKTSTRSSSSSVTLESGVIYDMGTVGAENYDGYGVTLPYVFSLYATKGTGDQPKYITQKVVTSKTLVQYNEASTGAMLEVKTSGTWNLYWSNKAYGQDNLLGCSFTDETTYFMLKAPLRTSLPSTFRLSFGFWADNAPAALIKDWKVQYSKDNQTWHDGASFEMQTILKFYPVEITPNETFGAGETLYLRWIPVGNAGWNGTTVDGKNTWVHFVGGVAITDVTSPDSKATGNVYAEDFDRINGGVDYRHAGQTNGIEKLGQLGEIFGDSIENWTAEQKNGLSGSYVAERPGYVQIGYATYPDGNRNKSATEATNHVGSLVTPALTEASGTITLSFKAMCYRSPFIGRADMASAQQEDVTDIVVKIKGAGSFDAASTVTEMTLSNISTSKFALKTLPIYNSDATTQIEFTSTAVSGKFTRWFIDDISVSK